MTDLEQVAEHLRTALHSATLSPSERLTTLLIALRQELKDRLMQADGETFSLMSHCMEELRVRQEAQQQVGELPILKSGLHPFQMAQGLVAGLELVLAEDLRLCGGADERGADQPSRALLRLISSELSQEADAPAESAEDAEPLDAGRDRQAQWSWL